MKDNATSAAVMVGLAVGIAFVILFSTFSTSLANYSHTDYNLFSRSKAAGQKEQVGKIVFAGVLSKENSQIYVVNVDGSGLTNLTNDGLWNLVPVASPDGSKIAYAGSESHPGSPEPSDAGIYVMNVDGSGKVRLTETGNYSLGRFMWSPDSAKVAYEAVIEDNGEIFVVNADGTGRTRLTDDKANDFNPTWASNNRIIFESVLFDEGNRTFTESSFKEAETDGSDVRKLFDFDYNISGSHVWSPDLRKIAYLQSDDGFMPSNLYVMDAKGGNPTRLAAGESGFNKMPIWSPDGSKIVVNNRMEFVQISVPDAASGSLKSLSKSEPLDSIVAWSPDGGKIAFTRDMGEAGFAIYVMNADGTEQRKVVEMQYPIVNRPLDWLAE